MGERRVYRRSVKNVWRPGTGTGAGGGEGVSATGTMSAGVVTGYEASLGRSGVCRQFLCRAQRLAAGVGGLGRCCRVLLPPSFPSPPGPYRTQDTRRRAVLAPLALHSNTRCPVDQAPGELQTSLEPACSHPSVPRVKDASH